MRSFWTANYYCDVKKARSNPSSVTDVIKGCSDLENNFYGGIERMDMHNTKSEEKYS